MVGRCVQELRGHLHRQDVRLVLLRDDGAPDVGAPCLFLGGAARLRDGRDVAPGDVRDLPLGPLRELVIADDPGLALRGALRDCLDAKWFAHANGSLLPDVFLTLDHQFQSDDEKAERHVDRDHDERSVTAQTRRSRIAKPLQG